MSRIVVIVPVYKVEEYLSQCVDSILGQTFADFDLILVDDGSPDTCGDICEEYKNIDSRVIVIHQDNAGLSAARNAGLDYAFANLDFEWICFIDSDDCIRNDYLQKLYDAVVVNDVKISACGLMRVKECESNIESCETSKVELLVMTPREFFTFKFYKCPVLVVTAWGKLYKRELFDELRYPVGKIYEDTFVTHLALFQCDKVAIVQEQLYFYTVRDNSITGSTWKPQKMDRIEAIHERLLYFDNSGYREIYLTDLKLYLTYIGETIKDIEATCNPDYKSYSSSCKKLLNHECRVYLKKKDISLKEYLLYRENSSEFLKLSFAVYRRIMQKTK